MKVFSFLLKSTLLLIPIVLVGGLVWGWNKGYRLVQRSNGAVLSLQLEPQPRVLSEDELGEVKAVAEKYLTFVIAGDHKSQFNCLPPDHHFRKFRTVDDMKRDELSRFGDRGKPTKFVYGTYLAYTNLSPERVTLCYALLNENGFVDGRDITVDKLKGKWWVTTWFGGAVKQGVSSKSHSSIPKPLTTGTKS